MNNLEHTYKKEELNSYVKYGKKINRTSTNDLVLIKWLEEFINNYKLNNSNGVIGVLGSLMFFLYSNNQIKNQEDCKRKLLEIQKYYNQNLNLMQKDIPFKLQSTHKHLLLIKQYKKDFYNNQQLKLQI